MLDQVADRETGRARIVANLARALASALQLVDGRVLASIRTLARCVPLGFANSLAVIRTRYGVVDAPTRP